MIILSLLIVVQATAKCSLVIVVTNMLMMYHKLCESHLRQKLLEIDAVLHKQADKIDAVIYDGQMHQRFQFVWLK